MAVYFATAIVCLFLILALFTGPTINIEGGDFSKVSQFNFGLTMAIICLLAIICIALYFAIKGIVSKKGGNSYLRKLSIVLVIFFILFALVLRTSENAIINKLLANYQISNALNGIISSGIILAIFTTLFAIGLIIFLELRKVFKA